MNKLSKVYAYSLIAVLITVMSDFASIVMLLLIPFFAYLAIKDSRESLIALAVYSVILVIVFSFVASIKFILIFAGFGVLIGHLVRQQMNSYRTIMSSTLYLFFSNLIYLLAYTSVNNINFFDMIYENYNDFFADFSTSYNIEYSVLIKTFHDSFVGIYFAYSLAISFVLYFIVRLLSKKIFNKEMESISLFKVEGFSSLQFILFVIVIALINTYDTKYGGIIYTSSILSIGAVFSINGFSLIYWYLKSKFNDRYITVFLSFMLAFVFPGTLISAHLGFIDSIFNFRKV